MKPEMSEFSYGFAFTNELITVPGARGSPRGSFTAERRKTGWWLRRQDPFRIATVSAV